MASTFSTLTTSCPIHEWGETQPGATCTERCNQFLISLWEGRGLGGFT